LVFLFLCFSLLPYLSKFSTFSPTLLEDFIIKKSLTIVQNSEVDHFISEIKSTGIDYFSLGIIKKNQVIAVFSSYQWQRFYLESQCFEFDPLVKSAQSNSNVPIDWHSVPINRKKDSFIMRTRKELTGCQEGFSLVKKIDEESSTILAFGSHKSFPGLVHDYLKYQTQVSDLIEIFKDE
jgi:hypothetical protein